jgi:superfamily I DNA/RNA helicase
MAGVTTLPQVAGGNLPPPIGKQAEVLYLPAEGQVVVLGSAGSGKSTIAVHRALYLANPRLDHGGQTLLLTLNRSLGAYLRFMAGTGTAVKIENYHLWARGYLNSLGLMGGYGTICEGPKREQLIQTAIGLIAETSDDPVLRRPAELIKEEIAWIAQHGLGLLEDYQAAERVGRGDARVTRRERPIVFQVYSTYLELREEAGFRYDWEDLSHAVVKATASDKRPRMYRHIIVDEMQNFSPAMLRSLVDYLPEDGSITIFGDSAQQIYGRLLSWRAAGLSVSKVWRFDRNYRNSLPIARLARAISEMPYFKDVEDLVTPITPIVEGPKPTIVECSNALVELELVVQQARAWGATRSVGILLPDRQDLYRQIRKRLPKHTTLSRDLQAWTGLPGIYFGTYYAGQGLEFDTVILPGLADGQMPEAADLETFGEEEALATDGKLFYVGVTRARREVLITHTGAISKLIPPDRDLYTWQKR